MAGGGGVIDTTKLILAVTEGLPMLGGEDFALSRAAGNVLSWSTSARVEHGAGAEVRGGGRSCGR